MPLNNLITIRKGTYSEWISSSAVLASGEPGFDTTNKILKIGDGTSTWENLLNQGLFSNLDLTSQVSGDTLLSIEGTNGNLFSVVDSVSGSLLSVNDITGLPAFEVFSDHSIVAGRFNQNDFIISSSGNVGIGKEPDNAYKLDVKGKLNLANSLSDNVTFSVDDSLGDLVIDVGGSEKVRVDTNGKVGIGITSPLEQLEVDGNIKLSDTAGNRIQLYRGGGSSYDYTIGKNGNHIAIAGANDSGTNRYVQFGYYNGSSWSPQTVINSYTGNVGIGTTSPSCPLTVQLAPGTNNTIIQSANTTPDPLLQINTYPTNLNRCQLKIATYNSSIFPNYSFINDGDTGIAGGFIGNTLEFIAGGTRTSYINQNSLSVDFTGGVNASGVSSQRNSNDLVFMNSMWRTDLNTNYLDGSYIRSVASTSTAGVSRLGFFIARGYDNGGSQQERFSLLNDGNVGIGTISPASLLHLQSTGTLGESEKHDTLIINANGSAEVGGKHGIQFRVQTNDNVRVCGIYQTSEYLNANASALAFHTSAWTSTSTSDQERMRISSGGNLGLGTTSPQAKIHAVSVANGDELLRLQATPTIGGGTRSLRVVGDASSIDFGVYDNAGNKGTWSYLRLNREGGYVGINTGTSYPTTALDVNGVITATGGNSTEWNTAYDWGNHASAGYQSASTALTTSTSFDGDVSGTYDNIVIADDSHNHIISNVDGLQTALDNKLSTTLKGANNGLAELDSGGKVPSSQLPSYVDDVLEYDTTANFPATGETGKIYVATGTNLTYRWGGSSYVEISASLALGNTSSTAYRGDRGEIAYNHSQATTGSVHGSTTVGGNLLRLDDPSAITFLRVNANNTISALDAAAFRTAIGAGTSSTTGTVTSVGGTGTVAGLTLTGTVTTTGNLTLGGTLSVSASNFSSQTAKTFLAAPNASNGVPTFRTIVASDIPTLNQDTTGSAKTLSAIGDFTGNLTDQHGDAKLGYSYRLTNNITGLFPGSNNSNSILTINRHPGNYYSQLGFSSDGNLYYRAFNNVAINTTTPWQTIWTSTSLTNLNQLTNGPGYTTNTGTVTSVAALTLGTTGTDVSSTVADSTTTPVITLNIPTASASNRGALSSTDWTTFNNKQAAITGGATTITSSNLTASRALVSDVNGKVAVSTITSTELGYLDNVSSNIQTQLNGKQATLTNPVTGTGTTNYVSKWTSSSNQGNSIIFDNGANVGIGTTSPSYKLDVADVVRVGGQPVNDVCFIVSDDGSNSNFTVKGGGHIYSAGNLDVRGSAVFNEGGGNNDFRIEGDTDANLFFVDASTDRVGIRTSAPSTTVDVSGVVRSFATSFAIAIDGANGSGPRISIGSSSDYTAYMDIGAYANINNINTKGRDFRLHSTTIDPILYAEYDTGNIGIGTSVPGGKLDIRGNTVWGNPGSDRLELNWNSSEQYVRLTTAAGYDLCIDNGNVGIGTYTPSYKLQVNGSFGATTKSFRIDHPSRPNYTLEYGSLESPYHGVRLTGRGKVVKGVGVVDLPSYLKDLIHDDENINIQLTNLKHGKTLYVSDIDLNNSQFTVKADRAKTVGDLEFFWTFTGVRKDVPSLVVEQEK